MRVIHVKIVHTIGFIIENTITPGSQVGLHYSNIITAAINDTFMHKQEYSYGVADTYLMYL